MILVSRGHTMEGMDDPQIVSAQRVLSIFGQASKLGQLVDSLPFCKLFLA